MSVSAQDVQKLRKATGAGMMDAKRALTETDGDFEAAAEALRVKGLADAAKRADRSTDEGTIGHYLHIQTGRPVMGTLVELGCETDFVAKTDEFQEAARQLAMHVTAFRPQWVRIEDVPEPVVEKERDIASAQAKEEDKPEHVVPRIVEGRLQSFYQDHVLYEQAFVNADYFDGPVKDLVEDMTSKLGENIQVKRFVRIAVGEGD